MPLYTQHYRLGIKLASEPFSASFDYARMMTIDNLFGFLGDFIGDGRVTGWHLSSPSANTLRVGRGLGVIDRFAVQTYGDHDLVLSAGTYKLYMRRRLNARGGFSDFGDSVALTYSDSTPPAAPTSLTVSGPTRESLVLSWTPPADNDLAGYLVYRSLTDADWATNTTPVAEVSVPTFTDTGLLSETQYYYRVKAVDVSGNVSAYVAANGTTSQDLRVPNDPRSVKAYGGDGMVQVTWLHSPDDFVTGYEITAQRTTPGGSPVGSPLVSTVTRPTREVTLTSLVNGANYKVFVSSVTESGQKSGGVVVSVVPSLSDGPTEVDAVTITESWDGKQVSLKVQWTPNPSAEEKANRYFVTFTEADTVVSSPVLVLAGTSKTFSVFTAVVGTVSSSRRFREGTSYEVRVQGATSANVRNVGRVATITTSRFTPPSPVTAAAVDLYQNRYVRVSWGRPSGEYDHVTLTVRREYQYVDPDTSATEERTEVLVNGLDVGKADGHVLGETVEEGSTYEATLVAYDAYGNASDEETASMTTENGLPLPPAPKFVSVDSVFGGLAVRWSAADVENPVGYRVYRTDYAGGVADDDYELLATVDPDVNELLDYGVEPNQRYAYLVATVDAFGNATSDPTDPESITTDVVVARYLPYSVLTPPQNVTGSASGGGFLIEWDSSDEFFDGWQVYRSVGGTAAYEYVGSVDHGVTSFLDASPYRKAGTSHHYIVRKFRDEVDVLAIASGDAPAASTPVGEVTVSGSGSLSLDESPAVEIENLREPILNEAAKRIAAHRHLFYSDSDDRRISLEQDWTVDDWVRVGGTTWRTQQDISDTQDYVLYVNGEQTDVLFELDRENGELTFEGGVAADDVVTVVFEDVGEVQGTLPESKISYLTASNFTRDKLDERLLPQISHAGRLREPLVPLADVMKTRDYLVYYLGSEPASGGTFTLSQSARTFYDILDVSGGTTLLAAASDGVLKSGDAGHSWSVVFPLSLPVTRVFKTTGGLYLALAVDRVYVATSLLTDWKEYSGMGGVGFVRDVAEDPSGVLYAATNTGVYRLDPSLREWRWEQRTQIDYASSECFATYYDSSLSALVVSTERGLFYTTDGGGTWTVWSAYVGVRPVWQFVLSSGHVFAVCEDRLYRKKDGDAQFAHVGTFSHRVRRAGVFLGKMYASSEDGVYASDGDPFTASPVSFTKMLPQLSEGGVHYAMTSLNVLGGRLLLGTDQRLFSSDSHGSSRLLYEQSGYRAATVWVDGVVRSLGVYFNFGTAVFDRRLGTSEIIEVATQYSRYRAANGGWAAASFEAPVTVYYNGRPLNDPAATVYPTAVATSAVVIPELTARNSYLAKADAAAEAVEAAKDAVDGDASVENVAALFSAVEKLRANVDPSVEVDVPAVTATLMDGTRVVGTADAGHGEFLFNAAVPGGFSKYSQLSVDVVGVTLTGDGELTHEEIDDRIEGELSGLPAGLARAHQCNLVKGGIFVEETWAGDRDVVSPPLQTEIYAGCTPTWYDKFDSTVDYSLRVRKNPEGVSLQYPACVARVGDEVWVGGLGGVIAIDALSPETTPVRRVLSVEGGFVRAVLVDSGLAYVVSDLGLYVVTVGDGSVEKESGFGLPESANSVAMAHNNLVVGASDGVHVRRQNGDWERTLAAADVVVSFLGDLLLARAADGSVYSSPSGDGWTAKGSLVEEDVPLTVNAVAKHGAVFFATGEGLYEDSLTFYSKDVRVRKVNLPSVTTPTVCVNDVASDGDVLVVALSDGRYYTYEADSGGAAAFHAFDESGAIDAIHKVVLVDGDIWLFGFDKLRVVTSGATVKLATGNRLSWQA